MNNNKQLYNIYRKQQYMTDISVGVTGRIRPNGIIIIICNEINNSECGYKYKISDLWLTGSFTFEGCAKKICVGL